MGRRAQGAPRLSWAGDGTWPRDWTSRVCPSRVRLFPASLRPGPLEAGQGPGDRPPGRPPHTRWLPGLQPRLFKWKRLFPPRTKGAGHLCATVVPALARSRVTGGGGWRSPGYGDPGARPLTPPALPLPRSCVRPVRPRLGLLVHVLGQLGQLRPQGRAPQPCGGLGKCPAREPRPRPDSVRGLGPAHGGPRKRPRR